VTNKKTFAELALRPIGNQKKVKFSEEEIKDPQKEEDASS